MPFMIGPAPIRRTLKYLEMGKIIFRDHVKIFSMNFNDEGDHHQGARDFLFWYLPQIQYKNPWIQCVCFKNITPSPFIRIYSEDGTSLLIDIDSRKKEEILKHLSELEILCKTKEEIKQDIANIKKGISPACFGYEFKRHCICEIPGQVPCPSLVPVPKAWRGIYKKSHGYRIPPQFMEPGLQNFSNDPRE